MAIRRNDPRTAAQKRADQSVQRLIRQGAIPKAAPLVRQAAIARARRKLRSRRFTA